MREDRMDIFSEMVRCVEKALSLRLRYSTLYTKEAESVCACVRLHS